MLKITAISLLVMGGLLIMSPLTVKIDPKTQVINTEAQYQPAPSIPKMSALEPSLDPQMKTYPVKKVLMLEERNTVVFRGPVTAQSVGKVMGELAKISPKLKASDTIYLVLDTPGGSIFDGLEFIDYYQALPQKITTITLFAASMGFQMVQNSDRRLITTNGTLMSHRASGSVSGQFDGELESRYRMVKRSIDRLDVIAANNMGISVEKYKQLINPEYWVRGHDAVADKAADEEILVRCGESLNKGTVDEEIRTFLGTINATFSKCPLLKYPVKVDFANTKNPSKLKNVFDDIMNQRKFVEEYVGKAKFDEVFPK